MHDILDAICDQPGGSRHNEERSSSSIDFATWAFSHSGLHPQLAAFSTFQLCLAQQKLPSLDFLQDQPSIASEPQLLSQIWLSS